MKKNSKLSGLYLGILFFLMYLPIGVVVVFSFNEARLPVHFTGFSLKWYQELFQDRDLIQALKNSLILAVTTLVISLGTGIPAAYAFSRKRFSGRKAILKLLYDTCKKTGKTVIVITHNQAICAMADRVIRIKNGSVSDMQMNPEPIDAERIEW